MAGKTTSTKPAKKSATPRRTTKTIKPSPVQKEAPIRKQEKPVFRASTWITILILAALVGLTYYLNRQKETATADETPTSAPSLLFDAADGAPSSIEVKPSEGEAVKIARNAENAWAIVLPSKAEADQGLAEAAATQISALKVINSVDAAPSIFGLDNPTHIITIEFAGGKKHTLEIGDTTPTNSGYYVRLDKNKMMITDLSGINSLLQLQSFPPYLSTPTPEVPVTSTP
jgi:hypothetical protein